MRREGEGGGKGRRGEERKKEEKRGKNSKRHMECRQIGRIFHFASTYYTIPPSNMPFPPLYG